MKIQNEIHQTNNLVNLPEEEEKTEGENYKLP